MMMHFRNVVEHHDYITFEILDPRGSHGFAVYQSTSRIQLALNSTSEWVCTSLK